MNGAENILAGQQILWCAVMVLGLEFIFLARSLKEEKTFLLLGGNILVLSMMSGIDSWIISPAINEKNQDMNFLKAWNLIYHVMVCLYLFTLIWLTRLLVNRPSLKVAAWHILCLGGFALAFIVEGFLTKSLFFEWQDWVCQTSWIYDWVFCSYCIGVFSWLIYQTVRGLSDSTVQVQRSLKTICSAYFILLLTGMWDILTMSIGKVGQALPVLTPFGVLAIGIAGVFIFTDNLLHLYFKQRQLLLKINDMNVVAEADRSLQLLGYSATRVSEEILSQVSIIKGDSHEFTKNILLSRPDGVIRIEKARLNLEKFSSGLLEFSASSKLGEMVAIRLELIVETTLKRFSSDSRARISVSGRIVSLVTVDKQKLSRALFEIVKNALESNAEQIKIRLSEGFGVVVICVEDNGLGCPEDVVRKIEKPFFTTRKFDGALGLGASIAEGIIRAHGGKLRFYEKLKSIEGENGLLVNIVFPAMGKEAFDCLGDWGECLLITDQNELETKILTICNSLSMRLTVIGQDESIRRTLKPKFGERTLVILDETLFGNWNDDGIFGWSKFYKCDSNRFLYPIWGHNQRVGRLPLCEETIIRIMTT